MTVAFDAILALTLLWLAWSALASTDLFRGVVLFIVFGLLLGVAWLRLDAPDLALAEVAVGAGMTGALLLSTVVRLRRMDEAEGREQGQTVASPRARMGWGWRVVLALLPVGIVLAAGWAIVSIPARAPGLAEVVREEMGASGVTHPVTAVLLNFRSWDTFLEVAVLLVAEMVVWSLATTQTPTQRSGVRPALAALAALLVPGMLLTAAYLLWIGAFAPGGAFQAGAVLGGAGVLLVLARPQLAELRDRWLLRSALVMGLGTFLTMGLAMMAAGGRFLEYPIAAAKWMILAVEAAVTISIALTLALLFLGGRPREMDGVGEGDGGKAVR